MDRRQSWLRYLPLAVGLAVTMHGWNNAFILDDLTKIVGNPDIRSLEGLTGKLVYPYRQFAELERNDPSRPLVFFLYTLVYAFAGGADPAFFHALNGVLHGVAAWLAWLLARALLRNLTGRSQSTVPLLTALLFAAAPLQVAVASYAYALTDILYAVFALGSCLLLARGRSARSGPSLVLLALGLASKQSAVVYPALWALVLLTRRPRPSWKDILHQLSPALALLVAYLLVRRLYFGALGDLEAQFEAKRPWDYLATQGFALLRYVQLTLVPWGLAIDHYIDFDTWSRPLLVGAAALIVAALVQSVRLLVRTNSTPRPFALGFVWFLICHAPTSLLLTTDILVERRSYLASFGLFFGVLAEAESFLRTRRPQLLRAAAGIATLIWIAYAAIAWHRQTLYLTNVTAWEDVLKVYPTSIRARNNLAIAYAKNKDLHSAEALYLSLLRDNPHDAFAMVNLGNLFDGAETPQLDPDRSLALYAEARRLKPDYVDAHYNYARNQHLRGNLREAEEAYRAALTVAPRHVPSLNNLGVILMNSGRPDEGRLLIERALSIDPTYAPALRNKEGLFANPARREVPVESVPTEIVIDTYRKHLKKNPNDAQARKKFQEYCQQHKLRCG